MKKMVFLLFTLILLSSLASSVCAFCCEGDRGEEVVRLQIRLRELNLFSDACDGIYSRRTADAVAAFQERSGLRRSGICTTATLDALGVAQLCPLGGEADFLLLSEYIASAADGQSMSCRLAVGGVVMNRVRSPLFPDTVRGVISQLVKSGKGVLGGVCTHMDLRAAYEALLGCDVSQGALYFTSAASDEIWITAREKAAVYGSLEFYL